jgi:hypothetical protein
MLTIVFVGCGDSKKPRAKRTKDTSGEKDKVSSETPKDTGSTEVADASKGTPAAGGEGWGNLKGKFIYNGSAPSPVTLDTAKESFCTKEKLVDEQLVVGADSGLANVVVWVKNDEVKIHPDYEAKKKDKVVINNEKCRFEPHVMTYWTGQPLEVKNSDPVAHNTNVTLPDSGAGFNESITANKTADRAPIETPESRPCPVKCNMHPWMSGHLIVQSHPYVAVSGADGAFELKNLPAGTELEFIVWQEAAGWVQKAEIDGKDAGWAHDRAKNKRYAFKYTIKPGDNDLGTIKLDASQFKPL